MAQETQPTPVEHNGRLASRLIQDWFTGRLVQHEREQDYEDELPTGCPELRAFPLRPEAGPDHDLVIVPSQSYDDLHDPEGRGRSLLCCMCKYCRYHFVFHIYPPVRDEGTAHLQHHLRLEEAEGHTAAAGPTHSQTSENESRPRRFRYACTLCGMTAHLEISPPRLESGWIRVIVDEGRIKDALRVAREQDPERYADIGPEKEAHYLTTALSTLNQYLKNILEDDGTGPRKRISFRNKTFMVQFGRQCDPIFRYLGFEEDHDPNTGDSYWVPPRLPPQEGKTPVGSRRAFFEDVRSEVQSLLDDKTLANGQPVVKPISARDALEKALGCDKSSRSVSTLSIGSKEVQHFTALGAPVGADDALLKFAYKRQIEVDPEHAQAYLEALGTLAEHRAEELQMFVFTQQELNAAKRSEINAAATVTGPVEKAYAHFGLRKDCPEAPEYFIGVYRTYRDQSPAQKSDHRLALLEIGRDRESDVIMREVYGKEMELAEACRFLGVEQEWPMDTVAMMAQSVASETDVDLLLMALDTISRNRPADDPNRSAFEDAVTVLRANRQPQSAWSESDRAGNPASHAERASGAVDLELPVGLANLRNTCYLNSILQYFYSVNAVRDLALRSDFPALEPTEESLSHLLHNNSSDSSEGSQNQADPETGRAFVGYEFTRELSTLFRNLDASGDSSISPRQRLANAALLRPEKLSPRSGDSKAATDANNADAPPLPPRGGENPKPQVPDAPMAEAEPSETASASSSQTLVHQSEAVEGSDIRGEGKELEQEKPAATVNPADQVSAAPVAGPAGEEQAKMSKLTVEELAVELDKPNVGSDQMDVDEVIGNTIDHLRAAFKVSHSGDSEAADPIKQAFFSSFIDNRKKIGDSEWNRTRRSDRWVTAYPAQSGTRDLYDALANSFDLEPLPGDFLSFTTIERPAPHFHVYIQRSDGVRKNANPITIPEVLYLDRFMHTADNELPLVKARKRRWDIQTRLNEILSTARNQRLEASKADVKIPGPVRNPAAQENELTEEEVDGFLLLGGSSLSSTATADESIVVDGVSAVNGKPDINRGVSDPVLEALFTKYGITRPEITPPSAESSQPARVTDESTHSVPSDLDGFWERFVAEETAERDRLTAERDAIFSDSHEVAYRLHAVVCHAGATASAGHYWVWIHDFERDVWRKYNDTTVSVHPAEFVFGELNTKGEPYYLAYVRADEVQNLVSIPRRSPLVPPPIPPRPASSQDTVMVDADDAKGPAVEHFEDVDMLPESSVPA